MQAVERPSGASIVRAIGKAQIYDPGSDDIIEVYGENLEWELVGTSKGELGTENVHRASYEVDGDRGVVWEVFEYPLGTLSNVMTSSEGYDVTTDFEYEFEEFENPVLPAQGPGIAFELTPTATIQMVTRPRSPVDELPAVRHLRDALRDVLADLLKQLSGTNAYTILRDLARKYQAILDADDLNIDLLYTYGVRLENARTATNRQIEARELPSMSEQTEEASESFFALHGTLIGSTARGRELLNNARAYQQAHPDTEDLKKIAVEVAKAIANEKKIIEHDAAKTVLDVNNGIGAGPHPARSTEVATTANRNILLVIGSLAAGSMVSTVFLTGFGESVPGAAAIEVVKTSFNVANNFFLANQQLLYDYAAIAGPDMSWLRDFVGFLGQKKRQSK